MAVFMAYLAHFRAIIARFTGLALDIETTEEKLLNI